MGPGQQAMLEMQPHGPVGIEVAVQSEWPILGPREEVGLWGQGPPEAMVGLYPGGRGRVWGQGTAGP